MVERIGEACGFSVDCRGGMQGLQLRCVRMEARRRRRRSSLCGLLWVVSRFKPAEAYAEGTKCARVRVCVLVCEGYVRADAPRCAKLGCGATEQRGVLVLHGGGRRGKFAVLCCKVPGKSPPRGCRARSGTRRAPRGVCL